jgi:ABC-type lipoprotein release transport system permease subunit
MKRMSRFFLLYNFKYEYLKLQKNYIYFLMSLSIVSFCVGVTSSQRERLLYDKE